MHSQPRRPTTSWAALKDECPASERRGFLTLYSARMRPHLCPALEPSAQKGHGPVTVDAEEATKLSEGWNVSPTKTGWEHWGFSWEAGGEGQCLHTPAAVMLRLLQPPAPDHRGSGSDSAFLIHGCAFSGTRVKRFVDDQRKAVK